MVAAAGQLGIERPLARFAFEDVHAAVAGGSSRPCARRADGDVVAVEGDRPTECVLCHAVGRGQFRVFYPGAAIPLEHVRAARFADDRPAMIGTGGESIAIDLDRDAELVAGDSVAGGERRRVLEAAGSQSVDVYGAGAGGECGVDRRADDGRAALNVDGPTGLAVVLRAGRNQLLLAGRLQRRRGIRGEQHGSSDQETHECVVDEHVRRPCDFRVVRAVLHLGPPRFKNRCPPTPSHGDRRAVKKIDESR